MFILELKCPAMALQEESCLGRGGGNGEKMDPKLEKAKSNIEKKEYV